MSIERASESLAPGIYIVASPIGNLADISFRAAETLTRADLIAAEDTRQTRKLLARIGSDRPTTAYHEHSGEAVRARIVQRAASAAVALVSDAGTPLISDPGYKLVQAARAAGVMVTSLPGPCAAITALTLAGLPTDRFLFAGFLPAKAQAARTAIGKLKAVDATLVFYESGRRLARTLTALAAELGARDAAVARELTKAFEEVVPGRLDELAARYMDAPPKGEIVIVVAPPAAALEPDTATLDARLREALAAQPLKSAVAAVASALGLPRKSVYTRALEIRDRH